MPAGRPSEYRPEYAEQAATLAINGATDAEIADEIGVAVSTIARWRTKYPEFRSAVQYGKEQADERVERSLYHRAVGFEVDTVKIGFYEGRAVLVEHREYYPPEPGAVKLWLTNRKPEEWRDKSEAAIAHSGQVQFISKSILDKE